MRAVDRRGLGCLLVAILTGLLGNLGALADSRIELRDGSVLRGELVGVGEGSYRVRTETLGVIDIPDSEVRSIRPNASDGTPLTSPAGSAPRDYRPEISGLQQQMMGNPEILGAITELQTDPELQAALSDPELARLVLSGDIATLQSDPRFQRLLRHPAIQAIVGRMMDPRGLPR
jgi:hypothetical protein